MEGPAVTDPFFVADCMIAAAAVVGNSLVLLAFNRDSRLHRWPNYFIASLASADLLVGLLGIPLGLAAMWGWPPQRQCCHLALSMVLICCAVSMFCLLAVSADRYCAIAHPFKHRGLVRTKKPVPYILGCWVTGSALGLLPVMGWSKWSQDGTCVWWEVMDYRYLVFHNVAVILLPALLMLLCYVGILLVVRRQTKSGKIPARSRQDQSMDLNPRQAQVDSERRLTALYLICSACSIVALICTLVVFGYWHDTLNICNEQDYEFHLDAKYKKRILYEHWEKNCGCLLYSESTFRLLLGGDTRLCHFVQFSNIPGIVVGLVLGFWHWYRISFTLKRKPKPKRRIVTRNDNNFPVLVAPRATTFSTVSWLCCAGFLVLMGLLTVTSAVLISDGTRHSCSEYRQNLIETIHADGNMAALIKERLFCNAVFDFMDYLQPVKYRHSANFINTGAGLFTAILAMWVAAVGWVVATIVNVLEAFRYRACCGSKRYRETDF